MEVVVLGIANGNEEDNGVDDGCKSIVSINSVLAELSRGNVRTLATGVLAKVLGLVSAEETLGLDLGSGTSGKLLVEADDTLHADSIRSGANGLCLIEFCQPVEFPIIIDSRVSIAAPHRQKADIVSHPSFTLQNRIRRSVGEGV